VRGIVILPLVIAAALVVCGCGSSPKKTFGALKDAAVAKDAKVIWANITPETQADLAKRQASDGATSQSSAPDKGLPYLETLTSGLGTEAIEYIKTLRVGEVSASGDTARMSVTSWRFGKNNRTLVFRKVDGKWKWDGRDILKLYIENKNNLEFMEGF